MRFNMIQLQPDNRKLEIEVNGRGFPPRLLNRGATSRPLRWLNFPILVGLAVMLTGCTDVTRALDRAGVFDAALREACASGEVVPATDLISEGWDRMLIVEEYTSGSSVNRLLGFDYMSDDASLGSHYTVLVLDGEVPVVEFTYSFGDGPPVELPEYGEVFDAGSLAVIPSHLTSPETQEWLEKRGQACVLAELDRSNGVAGATG